MTSERRDSEGRGSRRHAEALQLVVAASHDLRGALAQVQGALKSLQRSWDDLGERGREDLLETMLAQMEVSARRLEDILSVAALSVPARSPEVDLRVVAELCVQEACLLYPNRDVRIQGPPEPLLVRADPQRLRRTLGALVDNALKFSGEGGEVEVRLESRPEEMTVAISDEGPGIARSDLDRLFTPFARAQQSGEVPGTGLGLFLARAFAEQLGGRIEVVSRVGEGSTFTVRLPA